MAPEAASNPIGRAARRVALAGAIVSLAGATAPASAFEVAFPVACSVGVDCAIQNYVDTDPGADAVDYRCGHQTYDGHDGTDVRIPTLRAMEAGVAVLAAAAGEVAALRDGMDDISVNDADPETIEGRECGNGVLVDHGDGWTTQYCHMKKGSVRVVEGDRVEAGTPLGEIGLSGFTEFPHLHFEVMHDDETLDPFTGSPPDSGKCDVAAHDRGTLWAADARDALAYRSAYVLNVGFADGPLEMEQVESGKLADETPGPQSPALVFFGRAIGLETGDIQRLVLFSPDGAEFAASEIQPLDRPKAEFFAFAGKRRGDGPWPAGTWRGRYSVIRDGREIAAGEAVLDMPADL